MRNRSAKLIAVAVLAMWGIASFGQAPLPDLVISELTVSPEQMEPGDLVTLRSRVENQGEASVSTAFSVSFQVDGLPAGSNRIHPPFNPGQAREVSILWVATGRPDSVSAHVDSQNEVEESNETNNALEWGTGSTASGGLTWHRTGGPPGGIGYDVRIDPTDPNIVYVTDSFAGVHKSTDRGETWEPINDGITTRAGISGDEIPIFCLSIDPSDPETLWVGTINAKGVFRSQDGGRHWERRVDGIDDFPSDHTPTFRGFAVHPNNSDVVLTGLELAVPGGRPATQGVYGQIYKTTDGGLSWRKALEADNLFRRIEFNPDDPDIVYAGTGIFDRTGQRREGIFKSVDGGETWFKVNDGLTNLTAPYLALHPEDPDILFAATGGEPYFGGDPEGGVFRSFNGGERWEKVLEPTRGSKILDVVNFAPSDPDIVYAAAEEYVHRSTDGGQTWENLGFRLPGFRMGIPIGMDVDPRDPDVVYLNSYGGGVFRSDDGGEHWASANRGYTGSTIYDISVHPDDWRQLYTGTITGLFMSSDAGDTYQGLNKNDNTFELSRTIARDPHDPDTLYTGNTWWGKVFKSQNAGRSWRQLARLTPRLPELRSLGLNIQFGITEILIDPDDPAILYVSTIAGAEFNPSELTENIQTGRTLGIFKSTDGGRSWTEINVGLPSRQIFTLVMDPEDSNTLYAGTYEGIAKTTDGGQQWQPLRAPNRLVRSIAVDPQDSDNVYLGFDAGFYKSSDGGRTWQQSAAGLSPEVNAQALAIDPMNPERIFLGDRRSGVFASTDAGRTWRLINDGLRNRAVQVLEISADGHMLYAGTQGEGIYRLEISPEDEVAP